MKQLKSSYCANGADCVEVAILPPYGVAVRDSKDPDGPILKFNSDEWNAFILGVKDGQFDVQGN
jgi:Domain of unknown function (DUF397)